MELVIIKGIIMHKDKTEIYTDKYISSQKNTCILMSIIIIYKSCMDASVRRPALKYIKLCSH